MKPNSFLTAAWAACLVGSVALTSTALAAQEPTVDSVLAKYMEALGGKAAHEKFNSRLIKAKIESESFGASEGQIFAKAPNKQASRFELADAGIMLEGFDGTIAWAKTPWDGVRVKSGDELAKVKRDAEFNRELKLKSLYPGLSVKGTEKVGDEEACVLVCKPSATSKETMWFSSKTGLLIRQDSEYEGPQGKVRLSLLPQDYRTWDGVKGPAKIKFNLSFGDQDLAFTMTFLEIQHNATIDEAKFVKPAE